MELNTCYIVYHLPHSLSFWVQRRIPGWN